MALVKSAVRSSMTSCRLADLIMISSEESVIDNLDLSHIPTINQFALSPRGLPLTTVTLYLVLHIIGPIYMLMANCDNIHSPSFRIYFHRLNEFVFAKKMMQYNRARERGVVCMQSRSYYGANGASAPPGLFWDVLLGRKCAKIHLQRSRISKKFRR